MRHQTKGTLLLKFLLNTSHNSSKSEDSASFLNMTWNAAGQAAGCSRQNERENPRLRRISGLDCRNFRRCVCYKSNISKA